MITKRMIRKGMNYSVWSAISYTMFWAGAQGPILAGLLIALSMSKTQIGIINSLIMIALPMQLVGAVVQKRYFNRKKFWLFGVTGHVLTFGMIIPLLYFWDELGTGVSTTLFIALMGLGFFFLQVAVPSWFSWTSELVPQRDRASFWSRRESSTKMAMFAGSILFGLAADWLGKEALTTYMIIFGVAILFNIASQVLQGRVVDPDHYGQDEVNIPLMIRVKQCFHDKNFKILLVSLSIYSIGFWAVFPFYFVYMQEELGMSMTSIQVIVSLSMIISVASGYFFKIIGEKYGMKHVMSISILVKVVECGLWFMIVPNTALIWVIVPSILNAVTMLGIQIAQLALLSTTGDKENQSFSMAIFSGCIGLVAFTSSAIGGNLYEAVDGLLKDSSFSAFNVFHIFLAAVCVISLLLLKSFEEEGGSSMAKVVRSLAVMNPLRTIYQAHALAKPMHEERRLQVLSKTKSNMAASELIGDLYSPSTRVREAAIWSILQLETDMDEALIAELIKIMDCPALMIQAPAARALGHAKAKEAVPILAKYIYSTDTTLAQSCIYALGLIADDEALDELSRLLNKEQFRSIWPIAAEAIGKIGNYTNSKLIYSVYRHQSDWTLRKQTLVALINTVHGKRGFYNAMEREDKNSGVEVETRTKAIESKLKSQFLEKYSSYKVHTTASLDHFDNGGLLTSAESILLLFSKVCEQFPDLAEDEVGESLKQLFDNQGQVVEQSLLNEDSTSVIGWLIVNLWGELKYSPSEFDPYIHLAILWLIDTALKK